MYSFLFLGVNIFFSVYSYIFFTIILQISQLCDQEMSLLLLLLILNIEALCDKNIWVNNKDLITRNTSLCLARCLPGA